MTTFEIIMWAVIFVVPIGYAIDCVYGMCKYFKDLENETKNEDNGKGLRECDEKSQ